MENNVIFICPSWEDRSWLGFERDCNEISVSKVVVVKKSSPINEQEVSECIGRVKQLCQQTDIEYTELIWRESPAENWSSLTKNLDTLIAFGDNIHLDITTMPRDIIWTFLFFFYQRPNHVAIRYYQPKSYNDVWLSKEPYSPRLLLKHSGVIELGKPTCVVVITSFDTERTRQIVMKFDPQKIVLCVQKGEQFDNINRNNVSTHEKICRESGINDVTSVLIDFYSNDFGKEAVDNILDSLSEYNVILASFGPKPSAIGSYMAYLNHRDTALCYVPCKEYNKEYCKGIGELFLQNYK